MAELCFREKVDAGLHALNEGWRIGHQEAEVLVKKLMDKF